MDLERAGGTDERVLAIIPARGGSKGIPKKNLVPLLGRPLLSYSIEHAVETPGVDRVVVSTDDEEISEFAERWGAEVVRRPAEISGDTASSESALAHVLDELAAREGYHPSLVAFLQATSPVRRAGEVTRALATFRRNAADSLFSATVVHGFLWQEEATGDLRPLTYDYASRPPRQFTKPVLMENGSIYLFRPWVLRRQGCRLGGRIVHHIMDPLCSFQVDEPEDLPFIEDLLRLLAEDRLPRLGCTPASEE